MSRTAESPAAEGALPRMISRYEVLGRLATGGMAEVLLARERSPVGFEKLYAIKRMLPEVARDPALAGQLLDEARLAASLNHSNVVQAFDAGTDPDGTVFLVMEYLHGRDLRALEERAKELGRPVPLDLAIGIGLAVAAGLHYLHEKKDEAGSPLGLVHRDVSPHNVIVTFDGAVKLIDFGIAKGSTGFEKTKFGLVKGKPGYMSPEQCRGEPVDRRSDVFALAILLYELTTGAPPFVAADAAAYFDAVLDGRPVPPSERLADYPAELERVLMKGLARERRDRYATALEMQRELEAFAAEARLSLSPQSLASAMETFFPDASTEWRASRASSGTLANLALGARRGATVEVAAAPNDATTAVWRAEGGHGAAITTDGVTASADVEPARGAPGGALGRGRGALVALALAATIGLVAWVAMRGAGPADPRAAASSATPDRPTAAATTTPPAPAPSPSGSPVPAASDPIDAARAPARPGPAARPRPVPSERGKGAAEPDLDSPLPR